MADDPELPTASVRPRDRAERREARRARLAHRANQMRSLLDRISSCSNGETKSIGKVIWLSVLLSISVAQVCSRLTPSTPRAFIDTRQLEWHVNVIDQPGSALAPTPPAQDRRNGVRVISPAPTSSP